MHLFEENIKDLGLNIPDLPKALANYVPYKIIGKSMYISGQAPVQNGEIIYLGKVGSDVTIEDGIAAAKLCCINIIAAVKEGIDGDWDKLDSFVKLTGYVNSVSYTHLRAHETLMNLVCRLLLEKKKN